jgi:hypothetical protein
MKKENRKKKRKKEKKNGREKRGFVVVVASLLAVDCGVLQGRRPIGDLLQSSVGRMVWGMWDCLDTDVGKMD